MASLRSLVVSIEARTSAFERGLSQVDRKLGNFERSFRRVQRAMFAAATAGGIAVAGKKLFDLGAAVEETRNKFETVFGASAAAVNRFGQEFGRMAGLSERSAQDLLATTGAIVQGMGFAEQASADFSRQVLKLAGDLASFNNLPTEDVLQRINAALTGERESLKRLGVVILETDVQQRALNQTGKDSVSQLTQQEKATASLSLITERAGRAVGDLARTQDSAANRAKQLRAEFTTIAEKFAQVLLPALAQMLPLLQQLASATGWWVQQLGLAALQLAEIRSPGTIQHAADLAALGGLGGSALTRRRSELNLRHIELLGVRDDLSGGRFNPQALARYRRLVSDTGDVSIPAIQRELSRVEQLLQRVDTLIQAQPNMIPTITPTGGGTGGAGRGRAIPAPEEIAQIGIAIDGIRELTPVYVEQADAASQAVVAVDQLTISTQQFAVAAINTVSAMIAQIAGGGGGIGGFLGLAGGLLSFVNPIAGAAVGGLGAIIAATTRDQPLPVTVENFDDMPDTRRYGPDEVRVIILDPYGDPVRARQVIDRAEQRDAIQRHGLYVGTR